MIDDIITLSRVYNGHTDLKFSTISTYAANDGKWLASAMKAAAQAQGISTERRQKVEKEFAAQVDAAVTTVAKSKGLTTETAEAIKKQILGVS